MYTDNTFHKRCEDAAKRFLHSVVVIDNEAKLYDDETSRKVGHLKPEDAQEKVPKKKTLAGRPAKGLTAKQVKDAEAPKPASGEADSEEVGETTESGSGHELRAWVLTAGLADQEILCTVYRPDDHQSASSDGSEDGVVKRSVSMARLADIVVLDWELGDDPGKGNGSWKARDIIKEVLEEDDQAQGRLRLIAVYTAETKLQSIFQDVSGDLKGKSFAGGKIEEDAGNLVIKNQTTRIVFLNKSTTKSPEEESRIVSEEELPPRLVEEFAALSMGLIPSITLHSIAAIRETTHHLLATFNGRLDPALVCHRSLLPAPQDSEEFVLDLIAGELRSALSLNRIGEKHANETAHKHWIGSKVQDGEAFELANGLTLTRDEAFSLVKGGPSEFEKVKNDAAKRWAGAKIEAGDKFELSTIPKELDEEEVTRLIDANLGRDLKPTLEILRHGNLTGLLIGNETQGGEINNEFARLTSLKREKYGSRHLPGHWAPRLTQGTIIRGADDADGMPVFLLCTQPRCDSVRLEKVREFPFLILKNGGSGPQGAKQLLIIRAPKDADGSPVDMKIWVSPYPYQQKIISFDPANSPGDVIEAIKDGDKWVFNDGDQTYEWIADLKDFLAQKICDQVSGRQGTVGLDEYEWLRRQGYA